MTQRIIKFRAWNEETKKIFNWSFTEQGIYPQDFFNNDKYKVMQFTGLLDKNGKEIYEGDIVKTTMHYSDDFGEDVGEAEEKIIVVKWKNDEGRQFSGFDFFPSDNINNLEIIGNVWENPELLNLKGV
mgnify:CR=1 FL=1